MKLAALVGIAALIACAIGAMLDRAAFFQAWLVSWLFLFGISLAAIAQLCIRELTGGEWGLVLRPTLEAAAAAMPAVALLAIPLAFGLPDLFAWVREPVAQKAWYLNVPAFVARNAAWLVAWSVLAFAVRRAPRRQVAVVALLLYLVTVTFVAVDWVASLVPQWYSTAVGIRLGASQFVAAFATVVLLARAGGSAATAQDRQDFGNLLLTFCMTFAYFAFAQYLVVWGADIPHETSWFLPRVQTTWRYAGLAVAATMFAVPVILMLFRPVKRNATALMAVCAVTLAGAWLDAAWLVLPSLRATGLSLRWIDFAALVAQGALWLSAVSALRSRPSLRARTAHG